MAFSTLKNSDSTLILKEDSNGNVRMTQPQIVYMFTDAARTMVTSTAQVFADFQASIKQIMPMLLKDEQKKVHDIFSEFHQLLITSQTFLTKTTIRVKRATTNATILAAIDKTMLQKLCSQTATLLQNFWPINETIEAKLKEHKTFIMWRNIGLGVVGISAAVLIMATGVGVTIGFTAAVKGVLAITGSIGVIGLGGAIVAQAAQSLTIFQQVIDNLRNIEKVLVNLSENYAKQEGYAEDLSVDDSTKQEFLDLLKAAEVEVKKGFDVLRKM